MSEQDPNVPQPPQPPTSPQPPAGAMPPPPPAPAPPAPPAPQAWQQGPSGPRSSFGRRLVAYLLDYILFIVVFGIVVAIFHSIGVAYGITGLFVLLYFSLLEGGSRGQTLGKMAVGIRVVDFNTGGPIGYSHGFLRTLGKILSGIPCDLGYLWMLWDREKQCWQDKIATTVVVPVQYYPVT